MDASEIARLAAGVDIARNSYRTSKKDLDAAETRAATRLVALDNAQEALDTALVAMRKEAPVGSYWRPQVDADDLDDDIEPVAASLTLDNTRSLRFVDTQNPAIASTAVPVG